MSKPWRYSLDFKLWPRTEVACLRCGRPFMSRDVARNRICDPCNALNLTESKTASLHGAEGMPAQVIRKGVGTG